MPGRRLFERLFARSAGGVLTGTTPRFYERMGLDDPFHAERRSVIGFDLVYLTLPFFRRESADALHDELDPDVTAGELAQRAGEGLAAAAAPGRIGRRRVLERLTSVSRRRDRMLSRGVDGGVRQRGSRPAAHLAFDDAMILPSPLRADAGLMQDQESSVPVIRWGQQRPAAERRRGRVVPASPTQLARFEPQPRGTLAPQPLPRAQRHVHRPLQRAVASVAAVHAAHESRVLEDAAADVRPSLARSLRKAAAHAAHAAPAEREAIVRRAVRELPPTTRIRVSSRVRVASQAGASALSGVTSRLDGVGRSERSLRPVLMGSPSLVQLVYERPPSPVANVDERSETAPSTLAARPTDARSAARQARSQQVASRAGPSSPSPSAAPVGSLVPATMRAAQRSSQTLATTGLPTLRRGVDALRTSEPLRGPVARVVRRVEGAMRPDPRRLAPSPTAWVSGSPVATRRPDVTAGTGRDFARATAPQARATLSPRRPAQAGPTLIPPRPSQVMPTRPARDGSDDRVVIDGVQPGTSSPLFARIEQRGDVGMVPARPAPPSVRAAARSRSTRGLIAASPTHYVLVEPGSFGVQQAAELPSAAADASEPSVGGAARSARTGRAIGQASPGGSAVEAAPGAVGRGVTVRARTGQQLYPHAAPARTGETRLAAGRVTRPALSRAFGSTLRTAPAERALDRGRSILRRTASGSARVAPAVTRHVVRRSRLSSVGTSILQAATQVQSAASVVDEPASGRSTAPATRAALRGTADPRRLASAPARHVRESQSSSTGPARRGASGPGGVGAPRQLGSSRLASVGTGVASRTVMASPADASRDGVGQLAASSGGAAVLDGAPTLRVAPGASRSAVRASRRGEAVEQVGRAPWMDRSPMTHVAPEPVASVADVLSGAAGALERPAVVSRSVARASAAMRSPGTAAAALSPGLRHAAERGAPVAHRDSSGTSQTLDRVVRRAVDSKLAVAGPTSDGVSVRSSRRDRAVLGARRRVRLAQVPVAYLQAEGRTEPSDGPISTPSSARSTRRAVDRSRQPVRLDDRGVAQSHGSPTAYVGMRSMDRRLEALAASPIRRSVESGRTVLTLIIPSASDPVASRTETGAAASGPAPAPRVVGTERLQRRSHGGFDGLDRVERAVSASRLRTGRAASPVGTLLQSETLLVQAPGLASAAPGVRSVTRLRDVPSGSMARAGARLQAAQAVQAPSSAPPSRLARTLAQGRAVAVSPARYARLAADMSWVAGPESQVPGTEVLDRLQDRSTVPTRIGVQRRASAPDATVLVGGPAAEPSTQDSPVGGTGKLFDRSGAGYRPQVGSQSRPFSEVRPQAGRPAVHGASPSTRVTRNRRPGVETTLASSDSEPSQPRWALRDGEAERDEARRSRAGERSSLRADHPVLNAIARAESPEALVRLVTDGRISRAELREALPGPAIKLVERIVSMESIARQDERTEERRRGGNRAAGRLVEGGGARSADGVAPLRQFLPTTSSPGAPAMAANRVTLLANKLLNLIHLAEVDQRVQDAQQQVRMSDSEPGSSGSGSSSSESDVAAPNLNAFKRNVFEAVLNMLQQEANRQGEDTHGVAIWW